MCGHVFYWWPLITFYLYSCTFVGSLLTSYINKLILESGVPLKSINAYSIIFPLEIIFRLQIPFHHFISFLTLAPPKDSFQSNTRSCLSTFSSLFQAKGQQEVTISSTISGIYKLLELFFWVMNQDESCVFLNFLTTIYKKLINLIYFSNFQAFFLSSLSVESRRISHYH